MHTTPERQEVARAGPYNCEGYVTYKVTYSDGHTSTVYEHREMMEKRLGR